jgi:hypothetical protein
MNFLPKHGVGFYFIVWSLETSMFLNIGDISENLDFKWPFSSEQRKLLKIERN